MNNRSNISLILMVTFLFLNMSSKAFSAEWLSFEPNKIKLVGSVQQLSGFGPPSFGEDPKHDAKVIYYVLHLSQAINVKGDATDPLNSESIENVSEIQLVSVTGKDSFQKLVGKKVIAVGGLSTAISGGHYTNPILLLDRIEPAE